MSNSNSEALTEDQRYHHCSCPGSLCSCTDRLIGLLSNSTWWFFLDPLLPPKHQQLHKSSPVPAFCPCHILLSRLIVPAVSLTLQQPLQGMRNLEPCVTGRHGSPRVTMCTTCDFIANNICANRKAEQFDFEVGECVQLLRSECPTIQHLSNFLQVGSLPTSPGDRIYLESTISSKYKKRAWTFKVQVSESLLRYEVGENLSLTNTCPR